MCMYVAVVVLEDCLTYSGFDFLYDALPRFLVSLTFSGLICMKNCLTFSGFHFLYNAVARFLDSLTSNMDLVVNTDISDAFILCTLHLFVLTILALFNLNNLCFLVLLVCWLVIFKLLFRHSFFANFVGFQNCYMFVF